MHLFVHFSFFTVAAKKVTESEGHLKKTKVNQDKERFELKWWSIKLKFTIKLYFPNILAGNKGEQKKNAEKEEKKKKKKKKKALLFEIQNHFREQTKRKKNKKKKN